MQKDGSFLVLFKDDKRDQTFLVRRDDFYIWVVPGGGIEKGEIPKEAALREAKEETGFKVKILRFVGDYKILDKNGKKSRATYLFEGRVLSGKFKPKFPKCLGRWFALDQFPLMMSKATRTKVLDAKNYQNKTPFHRTRKDETLRDNLHLLLLLFSKPVAAVNYFKRKIKTQNHSRGN